MIDYINYYYDLYPNKCDVDGTSYYFNYDGFNYVLLIYDRNIEELSYIVDLNIEMVKYNYYMSSIVNTKFGDVLISYDNKNYILLKYFTDKRIISIYDIMNFNSFIYDTYNKDLYIGEYNKLWEVKIDYLEYEMIHYIKKYPLINSVIDYYIGLSENAIVYYNYINKDNLVLSISHKRIGVNTTLFDLYNPLNLIIDYRIRDISLYIQDSFFNNKNVLSIINVVFNNYLFDKDNLSVMISRLLFPVYFYDSFENIVSNNIDENILLDIIKKSSKYEDLIKMIIKNNNLLNISWLK